MNLDICIYVYIYVYRDIYSSIFSLFSGLLDHSHGIDIPLHLRPEVFRERDMFEGYKQILLHVFYIYKIHKDL